ncbi:MAG: hypothetical protein ACOYOB_20785, partial [Myxococcota bacterium]
MADRKDDQPGYGREVLLAAPLFGAKAVLGDIPKASLEGTVEQKLLGSRQSAMQLLRRNAGGRGVGRAIGGGMGILTAPLFLRGTRLLQSDSKEDRAKGFALIGASTAALAGGKGFFERALDARVSGASPITAASRGAVLGVTRSVYKVPLALATAAGIAAGRSKSKDNPNSNAKYVVPILTGAGAGAISRGIETAVENAKLRKGGLSGKLPRRVGASMAGGAAGGVLGALVLAKIVDMAENRLKPKEKKAGLELVPEALAAAAGSATVRKLLGPITKTIVALGEGYGGAVGQHLATGATFGHGFGHRMLQRFGRPGRAASGAMQRFGNRARSRQFALGLQEGVRGRATPGYRAALGFNYTQPELVTMREMG